MFLPVRVKPSDTGEGKNGKQGQQNIIRPHRQNNDGQMNSYFITRLFPHSPLKGTERKARRVPRWGETLKRQDNRLPQTGSLLFSAFFYSKRIEWEKHSVLALHHLR
jgi:hypothetical protein